MDRSRAVIDNNDTTPPQIAAYYGFGNHKWELPRTDNLEIGNYRMRTLDSGLSSQPLGGYKILTNNLSSVVRHVLPNELSFDTIDNPNTIVVSSIFAESDPSLTAAAYYLPTEVIKRDKKSNNDIEDDARYYRYHKMAEFVAPEDGSYNLSMQMKTDYPYVEDIIASAAAENFVAWRGIVSKNDEMVESETQSLPYIPNQIAEWTYQTMTKGYAFAQTPIPNPLPNDNAAYKSDAYQIHTVSIKDIKAGDVIRVWMTAAYKSGVRHLNTSLDTTKSMYLKNFTVNKIYGLQKNFLTVNGVEVGAAIGNWEGITGGRTGQRLTIGLGQNYFNGVVHEVLLYNRALSKQERETVEAYLYKRWTGKIIPAFGHSWNLPIESVSEGIYPALPSEGGYTAHSQINTVEGYPFFVTNEHPNIALSVKNETYSARILPSQANDFLGGGNGTEGYWAEWVEGLTANRQSWATSIAGMSGADAKKAFLKYQTNSEFRKITAQAILDQKVGAEFDCRNETIIQPTYPKVRLYYADSFVQNTVFSNGTIVFSYLIENSENLEYWIADRMEVEISDGRKVYRYRPEAEKWKYDNEYSRFALSGFVSESEFDDKVYTVTFRIVDYYGKPIPESEDQVTFRHRYNELLPAFISELSAQTGIGS